MKKIINYLLGILLVLVLVSSGFSALTDGLVAYYNFNGNFNDITGNGHNGVGKNGVGFTTGIINQGASFDGSNDYIAVSPYSLSQITISAWIYDKTTSIFQPIIAKRDSSYLDWQFSVEKNTNKLIFNFGGSTIIGYDSISTITLNKWYYVAVTYDGTTVKFYINGKLDSTYTNSNGLTNLANLIVIGTDNGHGGYYYGYEDELGIWNRALSATEIQELYNNGSGLTYPFITIKPEINVTFQNNTIFNTSKITKQ